MEEHFFLSVYPLIVREKRRKEKKAFSSRLSLSRKRIPSPSHPPPSLSHCTFSLFKRRHWDGGGAFDVSIFKVKSKRASHAMPPVPWRLLLLFLLGATLLRMVWPLFSIMVRAGFAKRGAIDVVPKSELKVYLNFNFDFYGKMSFKFLVGDEQLFPDAAGGANMTLVFWKVSSLAVKAISHTTVYLARPFIRHAHIIVFYFPECLPPTSTLHILLELLFSLNHIIVATAAAVVALYGREERGKRGMYGGEFEGVFAMSNCDKYKIKKNIE